MSEAAKVTWEREVLDELRGMRLVIERQTTLLEEYTTQLKDLQERMKPVERHMIVVQAITKGLISLVAVGATVKLLHDAYVYLFR